MNMWEVCTHVIWCSLLQLRSDQLRQISSGKCGDEQPGIPKLPQTQLGRVDSNSRIMSNLKYKPVSCRYNLKVYSLLLPFLLSTFPRSGLRPSMYPPVSVSIWISKYITLIILFKCRKFPCSARHQFLLFNRILQFRCSFTGAGDRDMNERVRKKAMKTFAVSLLIHVFLSKLI